MCGQYNITILYSSTYRILNLLIYVKKKKKIQLIDKTNIYVKLERGTTWVVRSSSVGEVWNAGLHFGCLSANTHSINSFFLHTKATTKQYRIYLSCVVSV